MPHQVETLTPPAVLSPPRPLQPSQPPKPKHSSSLNSPLLQQAQNFATQTFQSHVKSVLCHTSSTSLQQMLSKRVRLQFEKLPQEQLIDSNTSIEELLSVDVNLLHISKEDIDECYAVAKRVGDKWSEVLHRQGYCEFAQLVLDIVEKGSFLEEEPPLETIEEAEDSNELDNAKKSSNDEYVTPYTALHALRRYPEDTNGPIPSQYLPDISVNNDTSTARKVIQQIDEMAKVGNNTNWKYGWDAIEEAVDRNKERMHLGYTRIETALSGSRKGRKNKSPKKQRGDDDDDDHDDDDDEVGNDNIKLKTSKMRDRLGKSVQFQEDDTYEGEITGDGESTIVANSLSILKHGKLGQDNVNGHAQSSSNDGANFHEASIIRGRSPSSIEQERISWDDILQTMSVEEREQLIIASTHPPYSLPEMKPADDAPSHTAVVCGALKEIGHIHLWERTRYDVDEIDDEYGIEGVHVLGSFQSQQLARRKKRVLSQASRERLGRRKVSSFDCKSQYAEAIKCSKVKWTEEDDNTVQTGGKKESPELLGTSLLKDSPTFLLQCEESVRQRKWLDLDIGECAIEVVDDQEHTGQGKTKDDEQNEIKEKKKFLAFRGLELALKY